MPIRAFLFDRSLPMTGGVAHSFVHFARFRDPGQIALHAISCHGIDPAAQAAFGAVTMPAHEVGDRGYLRPALALRRLIRAHRPRAVLCCSFKPYLLAKCAALFLPVRVVFWHVAMTDILDGRLRPFLYRLLARHDDLLANSHATERAFAFPSHRGQSHVVHLGVPDWHDLPRATPAPRAERQTLLGIDPAHRVIAYTASFVPYKKHDVLLEAFAILAARHDDIHLLLIGIGPGRDEIAGKSAATPYAGRIHFAGARADARRLLGTIDIYVHPAVGEGFGIAVVEAMLAQRPIVAARAGALPELIEDGQTGLLSTPDDAENLAMCLATLLENPSRGGTLGRQARQSALSKFKPESYAAAMTKVVHAIANVK